MPEGNTSDWRAKSFLVNFKWPVGLDQKRIAAVFALHKPSQMIGSRIPSSFHAIQIRGHLAPSIFLIVIGACKRFKGQNDDGFRRGKVTMRVLKGTGYFLIEQKVACPLFYLR
jgi:hypothetical protein